MVNYEAWERWQQPDGAMWRVKDIEGAGHLILTSKGQELIQDRPELEDYFHAYLCKAVGATALPGAIETRRFIASGARSSVYEMAPGIAVKEANKTGSSIYALGRMDRLLGLIEAGAPRWIDIPPHYAVLDSRTLPKDYIVQRKIDSGITAEWLFRPEDMADYQRAAVEREMGVVSEHERQEVLSAFEEAENLVADLIERSGARRNDYLIDYHPGNVLVERLRTPIAGKDHKLWIIDQ